MAAITTPSWCVDGQGELCSSTTAAAASRRCSPDRALRVLGDAPNMVCTCRSTRYMPMQPGTPPYPSTGPQLTWQQQQRRRGAGSGQQRCGLAAPSLDCVRCLGAYHWTSSLFGANLNAFVKSKRHDTWHWVIRDSAALAFSPSIACLLAHMQVVTFYDKELTEPVLQDMMKWRGVAEGVVGRVSSRPRLAAVLRQADRQQTTTAGSLTQPYNAGSHVPFSGPRAS